MRPKISIFLPVRNGGIYYQECVASILHQTYSNFELIILDNASEDGSLEWIQSISDPRIIIYQAENQLTIEENWRKILFIPKCEFMAITGHDDIFDSNYIEVIIHLIEKNPSASLYHSHFRLINKSGKKIRHCIPIPLTETVENFLESRLSFCRDSFGTGYVFRSADYEKIGGIPLYKKLLFSDDALWLQLIDKSFKVTAIDCLFSYRVHSDSTSYAPNWRSVYDSLIQYLILLSELKDNNKKIYCVLKSKLNKYLIHWFQWGYFSNSVNDTERQEINNKILYLINIFQNQFFSEQAPLLYNNIRRKVFGRFARYYWLIDRYYRWLIVTLFSFKESFIKRSSFLKNF